MDTIRTVQGDTVDAIVWRYYGRTAGLVERVLDANPGLADLGPVLPNGTLINLPAAAPQAEQSQMVNLWD
ncbi:tail protein X [Ectopseudomonas guguanensis]|jgi:phage tail protein X|uniref:tail protein X n=1 Tax=Ectopseudomonas guguanensis TaxID=1198456 RepID=UPI00286425B6|nr:tail protein X [Pseudomonas guguanensis]MDR8014115.1 tail protein X [Pseudomonas guguanensis]